MIGQLSTELAVIVSMRPKQPIQSVVIMSIEQNIQCVYVVCGYVWVYVGICD